MGAATVGAIISNFFRIPSIVGFVVAGMFIGPFGFGFLDSIPGAKIIAEFGAILLLFTIGLELSLSSLRLHKRLLLSTGLSQLFITAAIVVVICFFGFGLDIYESVFWSFLISLSSTAIVMKLLTDTRDNRSTHGKAVTGILLTQDIAVIPMTLALPFLASSHSMVGVFSPNVVGEWLFKFFLVGTGVFLGSKYIVPRYLEAAAKAKSRELFFFAIVLLCLVFALAFESLNLSLALGAFLSGLLISDSPFGKKATADILLIRDIFLAIFFCSIGMLLDMGFVFDNLLLVSGVGIGVIILKFGVGVFAAKVAKIPLRTALVTGAMVFQVGEFSFVLAEMGRESGLISKDGFQLFLAITIFSMVLTPFSFILAPKIFLASVKSLKDGNAPQLETEAIIVGFGPAGREVAKTFRASNIKYQVIEHNFSMVKASTDEPITYGDGSDAEILHSVGIESARVAVICVPGLESMKAVVGAMLEQNPSVKIVIRTAYTAEANEMKALVDEDLIVNSEQLSTEVLAQKAITLALGTLKV